MEEIPLCSAHSGFEARIHTMEDFKVEQKIMNTDLQEKHNKILSRFNVILGGIVVVVLMLLLNLVFTPRAHAETQTINTVPSADSSFMSDLQTFLRDESAQREQTGLGGSRVVSGGIGSTSASLAHTISTVTAYVESYYVYDASISHTYTASKDTFVLVRSDDSATVIITDATITYDGNFVFAEMANSTDPPNAPSGTMMLFEAVTNATSITTVNDYRTGGIRYLSESEFADGADGRLDDAVDTLGSLDVDLVIDTSDTMAGNVTVLATTTLRHVRGNEITPNGNTLTINGKFIWGGGQAFNGSGVSIGGKANPVVYAAMWGWDTVATAANNATYLDQAVNALKTKTTLNLGGGEYNVDSATIAALTNSAFAVTADNINIIGHGYENTSITITGASECGFISATAIDNIRLSGIHFYGNGVGSSGVQVPGTFFYYDNTGGSANHSGIMIEECKIENCKVAGWITIVNQINTYSISDIKINDNYFVSYSGNDPDNNDTGVRADNIRFSTAGTGYIEDFEIESNWSDAEYIKGAIFVKGNVRYGNISFNNIFNAGQDGSNNDKGSYAITAYSGPYGIDFNHNEIYDPYSCGFYLLAFHDGSLTGNRISGQEDTDDSTLSKGAIVLANSYNVSVDGGVIKDSAFGLIIQPNSYDSNISVGGGLVVKNCSTRGIMIREHATALVGGVNISNVNMEDAVLRIQRGSGTTRLIDVTVSNCLIQNGNIHVNQPVYNLNITGNIIKTTKGIIAINLANGCGPLTCVGNQLYGPGSSDTTSYGIYANTFLANPSVIEGNIISGFYYGMYAPYGAATLWGNIFYDIQTKVKNQVTGDLGREDPGTIPNTVSTWWSQGQIIQHVSSTAGGTIGWVVVSPTMGYGNTKAISTTGDMTNTEDVITDVASIANMLPGAAITLNNAAAGPANLNTMILAFKFTYGTLSGTFTDGEIVSGGTSGAWGVIESDNGSNTMYITDVVGTFQTAETVSGLKSGASCVPSAIDLKVAHACGNTVNDETLSTQGITTKTWGDIGP